MRGQWPYPQPLCVRPSGGGGNSLRLSSYVSNGRGNNGRMDYLRLLLNWVLKQGRARTYLWLWVRKDMNMIHVGEMYKSVRTARSIASDATLMVRSAAFTALMLSGPGRPLCSSPIASRVGVVREGRRGEQASEQGAAAAASLHLPQRHVACSVGRGRSLVHSPV